MSETSNEIMGDCKPATLSSK